MSLDQLNNLDASNLKKIFDLPETTSDTYLQSAIKQAEEVKRTKQLEQNEKIMSLVEAAAEKGDANVEAVIKNYFGGSAISDDEFKKLTKGMDFTQYQARADEIIQKNNDLDTQKMNTDLSGAINSLRNDVQFKGAMRVGNREAAKEILIRNLNDLMLPRHIIQKFGLTDGAALTADNPALNQVFDELYDSMAQYQQGQIQANYAQQKAAIPALGPKLIEKNVAETEQILGVALDASVAKAVARSLGSRFLVNQDALIAAIDAMNVAIQEDDKLPIGDRIAIMQQTLQDRGAIPMQTYISEQGAALIKDTPQRPLTMEQYTTQEMSDLEADFKTITDGIVEIGNKTNSSSTLDEMVDLQRQLAGREQQLKNFVVQNLKAQENAMMTADGIDPNGMPVGWLLYGEKLDPEKINSIMSFITDQQAALEAQIKDVNELIAAKIAALPPAPEVTTEREVDKPSTTQSDLSVTVDNYVTEFGVERMIANQVGLADKGGIVGKIMQPFMFFGRELYENTILTQEEELRREQTRDWTSNNLTRLTEYGRMLSNLDPLEFSFMMNNLAIKTPEELENIYGEALDALAEEGRFIRPNT